MPKAKMTLCFTLTDVEEILGILFVMKNISNAFAAQLSGRCDLAICMMLMHSNHSFLENIQNEMSRKIVHNNMKIEMQLNEKSNAVCHFVYCFFSVSSITAAAYLLIRADVPANHSYEEGKKKKNSKQH